MADASRSTVMATSHWVINMASSELQEILLPSEQIPVGQQDEVEVATMVVDSQEKEEEEGDTPKKGRRGPVQCRYCDKMLSAPKVYYKHCRMQHNIMPDFVTQKKASKKCPLCQDMLLDRATFLKHMTEKHKFDMTPAIFLLKSVEDFEKWRDQVERMCFCRYVGKKLDASCHKWRLFLCHRDGEHHSRVPQQQRKRRLKAQGSVKMGFSCPAGIRARVTKGGVLVEYISLHAGHKPDREKNYTPLTEEEKTKLANAGLQHSWKRRNLERFKEEPKVKKVRTLASRISDLPSDGEYDFDYDKFASNVERPRKPLLDFTSPRRLVQSLIQPADLSHFFDRTWERQSLVVKRVLEPQQLAELTGLFSKSALLDMVQNHEMHFTRDLNALRYREGKREDLNDEGRITVAKLNKLFDKDRATVQVHQPQRFQDSLWQVMEMMESFFGSLVGANVYITPGGSQGLSPHHDDVEVFIVQLEGRKHWRLYKPKQELPRSYSIDLSESEIGDPIEDVVLEVGDVMYFPRGTIHQADTPPGVDHSTHITFSTYQRHAWGDYLMSIFPSILEQAMQSHIDFRRGLPINFIKTTKLSQKGHLLPVVELLLKKMSSTRLPDLVAPESMIEDFMKSRLPPHLVDGDTLRENLPSGLPPNLGSRVRLKHPDHLCFVVRKNPPPDEEDEEEEEDDEEEEEDPNQSSSSARFLSRSLQSSREEESLYVYSSIFNARQQHMMGEEMDGFALRFPKHYQECMTQLKASCDQFTDVSALQLADNAERENLIRALWSSHLLEVIVNPKGRKRRGSPRKSTKVD